MCPMIGHDCLILSRIVIDQREKITLALKILVPGALCLIAILLLNLLTVIGLRPETFPMLEKF